MSEKSGMRRGKRGAIIGVADNRQIAWGVAKALSHSLGNQ
jgi:enoyl-[acyl-carrier protein] reductase I